MRVAGRLTDLESAQRLSNYLQSLEIDCRVENDGDHHAVWVIPEDRVDQAKQIFEEFLAAPSDKKYDVRKVPRKVPSQVRTKVIDARDRWSRPIEQACPVTLCVLIIMVGIAVLTGLGDHNPELIDRLKFAPLQSNILVEFARQGRKLGLELPPELSANSFWLTLSAIRSGEVWRLVTPIFLHSGLLHIVFNLYYFRDMGLLLEYVLGSVRFLGLIILAAVLSNLLQAAIVGPQFGGMSGVNYALFGYLWIRPKYDSRWSMALSESTIVGMIAWFFICWIPGMNIANWAHFGGLAFGATAGWWAGIRNR